MTTLFSRQDDPQRFPCLHDGATQGTLRYDPISRRRPPDNFRFQYWPWQFPDKIDFQPLSSTLCRPKISGSTHFGKSHGSKPTRLARDNAHPSSDPRISCGNAAIASGPLVLIGSYRSSPCVAPFTDRRVDHSSFSGERAHRSTCSPVCAANLARFQNPRWWLATF